MDCKHVKFQVIFLNQTTAKATNTNLVGLTDLKDLVNLMDLTLLLDLQDLQDLEDRVHLWGLLHQSNLWDLDDLEYQVAPRVLQVLQVQANRLLQYFHLETKIKDNEKPCFFFVSDESDLFCDLRDKKSRKTINNA